MKTLEKINLEIINLELAGKEIHQRLGTKTHFIIDEVSKATVLEVSEFHKQNFQKPSQAVPRYYIYFYHDFGSISVQTNIIKIVTTYEEIES